MSVGNPSKRSDDLRMLRELLDSRADELTVQEVEAFAGMRFDITAYEGPLYHQLTDKQRAWVRTVHERIFGKPLTRLTAGAIPRGREVPPPPALQNLPKHPPGRKGKDDE